MSQIQIIKLQFLIDGKLNIKHTLNHIYSMLEIMKPVYIKLSNVTQINMKMKVKSMKEEMKNMIMNMTKKMIILKVNMKEKKVFKQT